MNEIVLVIIMLSIALAMDAFAISITLGMSGLGRKFTQRLSIALTFGLFQSGLFLLGYYALTILGKEISTYNSLFAGILLGLLGFKMLKDGFSKGEVKCIHDDCLNCKKNKCLKTGQYRFLTLKLLMIYGTATSIDAFAAGVSYGLEYQKILWGAISIGMITFLFSYIGVASGKHLIKYIGNKAMLLGGLILISLAIKTLI